MKGQNCDGPVQRMLFALPAMSVLLGAVALLGGCGGTESDPITINSAADIAQESNANYDSNDNGLISGATMERWLDDWPANRPTGITGKLVILQTGQGALDPSLTGNPGYFPNGWGESGREFLKHNDTDVFTYAVSDGSWVQARSNGVVTTGAMVADGTQMDALLKLYNIDPANDMIVFAMGYGGTLANMAIGRGWYMFRYWGIDKKNLAILNGGINGTNIINAGYFDSTPSTPPNTGTSVISQIRVDNTALQASLQEMMPVAAAEGADSTQTTVPAGGAFILDARGNSTGTPAGPASGDGDSADEYLGYQYATANLTSTFVCGDSGASSCELAFEGHIAGALRIDYRTLLDTTTAANAFMYISKSDIASAIASISPTYASGNTVYTYCRTTYRAMITGIATGVILGYPTKFYDGAWLEWGQLANKLHSTADGSGGLSGTPNLPADSPWRTDNETVSWRGFEEGGQAGQAYNYPSRVYPLTVVDPYAPDANAVIDADKAYKWGAGSAEDAPAGDGGGGSCG